MMINAESFHNMLFKSIETYAWAAAPMGKEDVALLLEPANLNEKIEFDSDGLPIVTGMVFECTRKFLLPKESSKVVMHMARYSLHSPCSVREILNSNLSDLPWETFCLADLLDSGFPRDTSSGIMKNNMGSMWADGDLYDTESQEGIGEEELLKEVSMHRRFAGICSIIMTQSRRYIDPLASDDEVKKQSRSREMVVSILGREN